MADLNDHSSRTHALLSASSSSRWLKCPPSAMAAELYPATDTEYTREGTLAHEVAEIVARRGSDFDVGWVNGVCVPAEMNQSAKGYADYIQELITSPDAVVLLEQRLDFSPWVPGGFGTGDCIILQGTRLDVVDYKYGAGVAVSAEGNSQMRFYGLGALNDFGDIYGIEEIAMHIYQPRMNNVSVEVLRADDLRAWGEEIKPIAALAAEGKGDFCSGEHCRFCPHAGACPKLAADCLKVVNAHGGKAEVPTLAPWMVADILGKESTISGWLKAVKERALADLLKGEEIPGYKVVAGRGSREWKDADKVLGILAAPGGYSPDQLMTEPQILSPAQMEKAIGKKMVTQMVGSLIVTKPGAPTVAPESDKRKPYNQKEASREAFND